jgi:antitoxin MazE
MQVRVQRWGNSLALRIPKPFAVDCGVHDGSVLELNVIDGKMVLTAPRPSAYTLDELLSGVRTANLHHEVDTGQPAGREIW